MPGPPALQSSVQTIRKKPGVGPGYRASRLCRTNAAKNSCQYEVDIYFTNVWCVCVCVCVLMYTYKHTYLHTYMYMCTYCNLYLMCNFIAKKYWIKLPANILSQEMYLQQMLGNCN